VLPKVFVTANKIVDSVSFIKALLLEMSQVVVVTKETLDYLDTEVLPIEEHFAVDRLYTRTGSTLLDLVPFKLMLRACDSKAVATKDQAGTSDDDDDDGINSNSISNINSVDNAGSNSSSSFSHEK
jgi:hypothetical protein